MVCHDLKATARFGLTEQRSRSDEFYPSDHLKFASYSTDRLTEKGSYDLENGEQHSLSGKFDVQYNVSGWANTSCRFDFSQERSLCLSYVYVQW